MHLLISGTKKKKKNTMKLKDIASRLYQWLNMKKNDQLNWLKIGNYEDTKEDLTNILIFCSFN